MLVGLQAHNNMSFTAPVAQASVSLANNGGDIGKTLKDLGSSNTVKNTLVEGNAKATVPPMPQGPVTQDIKLEKLDKRDKK